jgi:type II secretory pathway component PulJ
MDDVHATRVRHRDRGATLMELLISITVMAIIAGVLLTVVATFLRNDASANERIDESRDLQQIAVYMPADVASAFQTELVDSDTLDPTTASPCSGYTGTGDNILSLRWHESFGGSTTQYRVQYRTEVVDGETQVVRISCEGTSLGSATTRTVARHLHPTIAPVVDIDADGAVVKVTLTEETGRELTINATTQNPNAELEYTSDLD